MRKKKRELTPEEEKKSDRLAEALRGIPTKRIQRLIVKTESLTIRLTLADKTSMELAAKACHLTLTDYLTRLHYLVSERLFKGKVS